MGKRKFIKKFLRFKTITKKPITISGGTKLLLYSETLHKPYVDILSQIKEEEYGNA